MRNRTCIPLSAALVFLVTAFPVASTRADSRVPHGRMIVRHDVPTFSASGEYTGSLDGEIQLNGTTYRLSPDAVVYEIGNGLVPLGTAVGDRFVFLAGTGSSEDGLVTLVIIRPASDAPANRDGSDSNVSVKDDATPE